ncbi:oligosaccharide flippase family protein [bacterium]|nr:oligosaccharide flippase family protein [bacterium]
MSEGRKFSRESSIYVIGEFISKAFSFLLLPVYTSYLSLEDFAIYSFVTMIWPVVLILLGKSFSAYMLRGYYEYEDKRSFLGTVMLFSMSTGVLITACIHFTGPVVFPLIFKNIDYKPFLQYGVFFGLYRLFFTHVVTIFRAKREPRTSVMLSIAQFAAQAAAVAVSIFILKTDLLGILQAQLIAFSIITVLYLFVLWKEIRLTILPGIIRPSLVFIMPLHIHAAASWVVVYASRIFIERSLTLVDVSVYAAATQLSFILTVINNGLNQAWSPFVYANAEQPAFPDLFSVNARKLVVAEFLTGTVLILFSRELLTLLGKTEYQQALAIFPLLVGAYLFQMLYFIYVAIIVYHKRTSLLPLTSAVSGGICMLLNWLLVPVWGTTAAALSTLVSFIIMFAAVYLYSKRYLNVIVWNPKALLFLFSLVCAAAVFYIWGTSVPVPVSISLKIGTVCLLVLLLERLKLMNIREFTANLVKNRIQ